jgi:hypothetical protein
MRIIVSALISLLAACAIGACGGGASSDSYALLAADRVGDIWIVDPSNGDATPALNTWFDSDGTNVDLGVVSGMAYHEQSGRLLASTSQQGFCDSCLYAIDVITGGAEQLASIGAPDVTGLVDLAVRSDGAVFASEGGDCGDYLYLLNPADGTYKRGLAAHDCSGNALTFSRSGMLYWADTSGVYALDVTIGDTDLTVNVTAAEISYTGFPLEVTPKALNSMTTHPGTGTVLGIVYTGGSTGDRYLSRVNLSTATVTHIGLLPAILDGLAWVPMSAAPVVLTER